MKSQHIPSIKCINISFWLFIFFFWPSITATAQTDSLTYYKYKIKGLGYLHIPDNMELQSGDYKKIAESYTKEYLKKFGLEVDENRLVFQQKGLNTLEKNSFTTYARVLLETEFGKAGDFEKLTSKIAAKPEELKEFGDVARTQIEESFKSIGQKIISWYGVSIVTINNRSALKLSYLRQLNSNPYVLVNIYKFQNYDRMYTLTMSYRKEDEKYWKAIYETILNSFTITNIR